MLQLPKGYDETVVFCEYNTFSLVALGYIFRRQTTVCNFRSMYLISKRYGNIRLFPTLTCIAQY